MKSPSETGFMARASAAGADIPQNQMKSAILPVLGGPSSLSCQPAF